MSDLGRWMKGDYKIAGGSLEEDDEIYPAPDQSGGDGYENEE